jgi:hypothetical protein
MGLALTSVISHLSSDTVRTWDDETSKWIEFKAEHPRLAGVISNRQREVFRESLVKDLIKHRVITSRARILDGNTTTWRQNGDKIRTDGTPVQGVRSSLGYKCVKCPVAGRAFQFMRNHKHTEGDSEGNSSKNRRHIRWRSSTDLFRKLSPFFPSLFRPSFLAQPNGPYTLRTLSASNTRQRARPNFTNSPRNQELWSRITNTCADISRWWDRTLAEAV